MKKRLISLLVALCMAVTLLPVSAITAWAEEGGSTLKPLQIRSGYPVLDDITPTTNSDGHEIYTGKDWSYDGTAKVLTIAPESLLLMIDRSRKHPSGSNQYFMFCHHRGKRND